MLEQITDITLFGYCEVKIETRILVGSNTRGTIIEKYINHKNAQEKNKKTGTSTRR
jgi:hypothetical protein